MTNDSVWITGARGFIGRHLARECASRGMHVSGIGLTGWDRQEAARWGISSWVDGGVSCEHLDLLAREAPKPALVFHLAGGSSVGASLAAPADDFRRSVGSTREVLDWIRRGVPDATVVLASSAAVYGAGHDIPIQEDAACKPCSPYGLNKRWAELLCEQCSTECGLSIAIVRLFSVYGPELRKQLLWDLCTRLSADPGMIVLSGTGEERRDLVHVADAVRCLLQCAEGANVAGGLHLVNCGTGVGSTVREIAQAVIGAWELEMPLEFTGTPREGDPRSLVSGVVRASGYGWTPRIDWRDGLGEYVTWFRGAGVTVAM